MPTPSKAIGGGRQLAQHRSEVVALEEVRERLHRKANSYFLYEFGRWDQAKWRLFFGATDALLDTQFALSDVAEGLPADKKHAILACYGYLQALYIQQDAVTLIWRALDIPGDSLADAGVQKVRELRNRIAGHPARAEKLGRGKRSSSAIINLHDIDPAIGFKAIIYYDDDMDVVDVSFSELLEENCFGLLESLLKAERIMVERETAFRELERGNPLAAKFENGMGYILEKLRCGPEDSRRDMAMRMLTKSIDELEVLLKARHFWYDASEHHIDAIRAGIELGERLIEISPQGRAQQTWWIISEGIDSHVKDLLRHLSALDEKLAETPG
jgi:broad specificity phosphatase PhoE